MTTGPLDNFFAPNLDMRHYRPADGDLIVIKSKVMLTQEQMKQIHDQWERLWAGVSLTPRLAVLDQDVDIEVLRQDEHWHPEGWAWCSRCPPKSEKLS